MLKVLLAVDGSPSAVRATQTLIDSVPAYKEMPEIHILTVHRPLPNVGTMASIITTEMRERYYREECDAALAPCTALFYAAGLKYQTHRAIGPIAPTIVQTARELGCESIYMGTRGHSAVANVVVGSIATQVLHLAGVPVTLVH